MGICRSNRLRWALAFCGLVGLTGLAEAQSSGGVAEPVSLEGLHAPAEVFWDEVGVPHIVAASERDAAFLQGRAHARDRYFQMDVWRRTFGGTASELFGERALTSDVRHRRLGYRRAAEVTWEALCQPTRAWLEAYAEGVNGEVRRAGLPFEYAALELTTTPPWTPLDTLTLLKGLLAFQVNEMDLLFTVDLDAAQRAGEEYGFDGSTFFFEDVYRADPPFPAVTFPGALQEIADAPRLRDIEPLRRILRPEALALARRLLGRPEIPTARIGGSNWWVVSGSRTESGRPILAHDPHLPPSQPMIFYEAHLTAEVADGEAPLEVGGVGFAGVPGVALGCSPHACWGATVLSVDSTDVFQEELVLDPQSGRPTHVARHGASGARELEALIRLPQVYRANVLGNKTADDLTTLDVAAEDGGEILVVARHGGPLLAWTASAAEGEGGVGLSLAYASSGVTLEVEAWRRLQRVDSLDAFRAALRYFDVGAFNWSYADIDGRIAAFTTGELPLRDDLENLGRFDRLPPNLLRDGTGRLRHDWLVAPSPTGADGAGEAPPDQSLPWAILPFEQMPQEVDPPSGVLFSANNDPNGVSLDNDPFNQRRPGGGVLYLGSLYISGLRMGRIARLLDAELADGGKLSVAEAAAMQADFHMSDAEQVVPFVVAALDHGRAEGAPAPLAALATDARVAAVVERWRDWDFTGPTGIAQGYDPGDDPTALGPPSVEEIRASVAATLFGVYRGQLIDRVIDRPLRSVGLEPPPNFPAWRAVLHRLERFGEDGGVGESGFDFLAAAASVLADPSSVEGAPRLAALDVTLLEAVSASLELLESETFAPVFAEALPSDDALDKYRWGLLHRHVFPHPFGASASIPGTGGFTSANDRLPGIARAGGYDILAQSIHQARGRKPSDFAAAQTAAMRMLGLLGPGGPEIRRILPGGQSADPSSPHYADQLGRWLTNRDRSAPLDLDKVRQAGLRRERLLPNGNAAGGEGAPDGGS